MGHFFGGKTYDFEIIGEKTSSFLEGILGGLDTF